MVKRLIAMLLTVLMLLSAGHAEEFDVLRSLGIEISQDDQVHVQAELDEINRWLGEAVDEYNRYETIIGILGYGGYDETTYQYISYSDDVYAFDAEAWDIITAYQVLLEAVERMSDGAVCIDNIRTSMTEKLFDAGVGKLLIQFSVNGEECRFIAEFYYDWMDCGIIDYLNNCLEEQGHQHRIWSLYDGGQGLILMCKTKEWMQRFENKTGVHMWIDTNAAFESIW